MANDFGLKLISVETGRAKKEDLQRYTDYVYKDLGDGRWKTAIQVVLGV
jgi:ribonucleotide monophosphatase NagD (HAD superfamily)